MDGWKNLHSFNASLTPNWLLIVIYSSGVQIGEFLCCERLEQVSYGEWRDKNGDYHYDQRFKVRDGIVKRRYDGNYKLVEWHSFVFSSFWPYRVCYSRVFAVLCCIVMEIVFDSDGSASCSCAEYIFGAFYLLYKYFGLIIAINGFVML